MTDYAPKDYRRLDSQAEHWSSVLVGGVCAIVVVLVLLWIGGR